MHVDAQTDVPTDKVSYNVQTEMQAAVYANTDILLLRGPDITRMLCVHGVEYAN